MNDSEIKLTYFENIKNILLWIPIICIVISLLVYFIYMINQIGTTNAINILMEKLRKGIKYITEKISIDNILDTGKKIFHIVFQSNYSFIIWSVVFMLSFIGVIYYFNFIKSDLLDSPNYKTTIMVLNGFFIFLSIIGIFILSNHSNIFKDDNSILNNDSNLKKGKKVFGTGVKYLYNSIVLSLVLGITGLLVYLISNNKDSSIFTTKLVFYGIGIAFLFFTYNLIQSNDKLIKKIRSNPILQIIYYSVFIIPCIFFDIVKYLYNHLRHTPTIAYYFLLFEIVVIFSYIIIPIIKNELFTILFSTDTSNYSSEEKKALVDEINELQNEKEKIIYNNTWCHLRENDWKDIISEVIKSDNQSYENIKTYLKNKNITNEECIKYVNDNYKKYKNIQRNIYEKESTKQNLNSNIINYISSYFRKSVILKDNKNILPNPIYLNPHTEIILKDQINDTKIGNYNYAISFWIFLHQSNMTSDDYIELFNFCNSPKISYNYKKGIMKFNNYFNDNLSKNTMEYELEVPIQKWNNVFINYDKSNMDVYINGELKTSFPNIISKTYNSSCNNVIKIGDSSIHERSFKMGGISNIIYYPISVSQYRISMHYNYFKNKNPPV